VADSVKSAAPTSLLGTAFGGGLTGSELDALNRDAPPTDSILKNLTAAKAAVSSVSAAEGAAYSNMIIHVAENVAAATKEGGFLGIGGKQVSGDEEAALSAIKAALN
jgi:hypothetical protein